MFGLKRFRVRTNYNEAIRPLVHQVLEGIDSIIIRQQFTTSPKDFLVLCEVHWSQRVEDPQARLSEIAKGLEWFQEIIVISSERKSTLCFVKGVYDKLFTELFLITTREYLCFIEYPVTAHRDHAIINLIGPPKDVERLIDFVGEWGATFVVEAITDYHTKDRGVLTALTNKQLAALRFAHRKGFFDHPRKMDARELASRMGVRHTTFLTHIRRGQRRMLDELFRE